MGSRAYRGTLGAKLLLMRKRGATPVVLPATVTPTAVYGIKQPGWGGNAYLINGLYTVGWAADNTPDAAQMAAAVASAGGSAGITSITCYDTTGNGFHATQAVAGNCMGFDALSNFRGRVQLNSHDAQMGGLARYLNIPAMTGMDASNYAVFGVFDIMSQQKTGNLFAFKNLAATFQSTLAHGSVVNGLSDVGTSVATSGIIFRAQPAVYGLLSAPAGRTFYGRETTVAAAAIASNAMTGGGCIGTQAITPANNGMSAGFFCAVVYNLAGSGQTMSAAQGTAICDALKTGFEVTTDANKTAVLIGAGDSIDYGYSAFDQVSRLRTAAAGRGGGRCEIFNVATSGVTMQTLSTEAPCKVVSVLGVVSSWAGPIAVINNAGTNDISAGATALTVTNAQTAWQTKVTTARPGVPIIYEAITPRNDGSWSAPKDVIAVAVNSYRAALTGGASAYVDYRSLLHNQVQADASDPLYYNSADLLHPTQLNHVSLQGPLLGTTLAAYLP